jgi:lysophospholipase
MAGGRNLQMGFAFQTLKSEDGLSIRWGKAAADGRSPCGSVLLLNGRTEYMEKYQETAAALTRRNWTVYSLDWRGQGLSERMLSDRHKGFVGCFEDYLGDLDRLVDKMREQAAPRPWVLLGHSMGGHIGIRYVHNYPGLLDCVVLTSPMLDIQLPGLPRNFLRGFVRMAVAWGGAGKFAPGGRRYLSHSQRFQDNPLTTDVKRFQRVVDDLRHDPRLALGGVTFGWLRAAFDSIDRVMQPSFAHAITLPVLMVCAGDERIVCPAAQKQFGSWLSACRRIEVEGARHELLVETDDKQAIFWEAFDRFVAPDRLRDQAAGAYATQARPSSATAAR